MNDDRPWTCRRPGRSRGSSVPGAGPRANERLRDRTKADYLQAKIETAFGDLPLDALDDPRVTFSIGGAATRPNPPSALEHFADSGQRSLHVR